MRNEPLISIITAVHNCLPHNQIFLESVQKYTYSPYELIIIDNASTDGSDGFFRNSGCTVLRNEKNLCYPESMNQGLAHARGEYICLLNNDVFCGVHWDRHLIEAMALKNLDAVSPCGIERMPSLPSTHLFSKRWRGMGEKKHLKFDAQGLQGLLFSMYGNWETFCDQVYRRYYPKIMEGIVGNCVFLKRSVLEKIGPLDETIQSADWDLYLNIRKRAEERGDVHRVMTVCCAYVHHFIRTTLKSHPQPFACAHPRRSVEEKWAREEIGRLWPFPHETQDRPVFYKEPVQYGKYKWGKIRNHRIRTEHEDQWIQFWKELDRA